MQFSENRQIPSQEVNKRTSLPAFSEGDWEISSDEQQVLADTKITAVESIPTVAEKKRTRRKTNADGTRRTSDQILNELKQSLEASTDEALYARQIELEKKQAFGNITVFEGKELQYILNQQQSKRDATEQHAMEDLIANMNTKSDTNTVTSERAIPPQATVPVPSKSFFSKVKTAFSAIGNLFSRNKIDQAMKEMESMTDEEVRASVVKVATRDAATRNSKAEAYASKLESTPSTARKVFEKAGDTFASTIDTAQNVLQSPISNTDFTSEKKVDAIADSLQAKADLKEGRQLTKWSKAIDARAARKQMTRMEALVDRIQEINSAINADGLEESDPALDPRVAELQYLEVLLEEPNIQNTVRDRNSRPAAKRAISKAKRDINTAAQNAGKIRGL